MKPPLGVLLRLLGLKEAPLARNDKSLDEEVRLFLSLKGERVLVGRLRKEGDEYVFAYSEDFRARPNLPPLPDFPNTGKAYHSPDLWPFFLSRLPPADRADVEQVLREEGISPENVLEVLGKLGRKAISSPYEIELAHV